MESWKKYAIAAGVVIALVAIISIQSNALRSVRSERDRQTRNAEALLSEIDRYKTQDSLNAAQALSMELTLRDFERFRAEDAKLIQTLKAKNRDLERVNKSQAETIVELSSVAKDTVIIRDSIKIDAVSVHCGDEWFDFNGVLAGGQFTGKLINRESLVAVETVKYKRFLGFLWKTGKVKDRTLDIVSKNPHTTITGVESITIKK